MSSALDASIAANRFGFGARPGELSHWGAAARDALAEQLTGPAPGIAAQLPASHDLLARIIAAREERRQAGEDPAAVQLKLAKQLRDVYAPAYVDDARARFEAAVSSDRSFVERLVQFWSNHFAVSVDKVAVLGLAGAMEREAIRPHVLGRFPDMLKAVEQHPAMLIFLDNQASIGPGSAFAQLASRRGNRRAIGLNENLGREILELHTLGVDGGYTQQDVTTLAMIITGWSVGGNAGALRGGEPGRFVFREALHEPGAKSVLGRRYAEEGLAQGERVLRDLALHPRTARHLATQLARHFIADEPPAAVVDRLSRAYLDSEGDLPSMYRVLLAAPESWVPAAVGPRSRPSSCWVNGNFSPALPRAGPIGLRTGMDPPRCSSVWSGPVRSHTVSAAAPTRLPLRRLRWARAVAMRRAPPCCAHRMPRRR